jgi:hypothetical protein
MGVYFLHEESTLAVFVPKEMHHLCSDYQKHTAMFFNLTATVNDKLINKIIQSTKLNKERKVIPVSA